MTAERPIGVLDSGLGGISVLNKIHDLLPCEHLLYVADSAHAPYGSKSGEYIVQRCRHIMDFFLEKGIKALVLACNTATAAAVAELRAEYSLPIIGMEPAVKPAAEQSRSGVVGVLATEGTIASDKFITLKSRFTDRVEIITTPCTGLVEQIENPDQDASVLEQLLETYLAPLREKQVDTLVLGCTHYSLIIDQIAAMAGDVMILDTGLAVARELQRRLEQLGLLHAMNAGEVEFYTSGDPVRQSELMTRYWQTQPRVLSLPA